MDKSTKPCARCKVAPRNCSSPSYCRDCHRALARESRDRRGQWKKPQSACSRCGGERDGRHPSYCRSCWQEKRKERYLGPCGRCGKVRAETDRTNSVYCYECWRDWWLRRKYGLTGAQYEQLLAEQGGQCALCLDQNNGRTWHVDHCHATNRVRGLLCDLCNRGLGHFRDDPALLRRAAEYVEAHASV